MRGFSGFDEFISARGGIASRRELLEAGWTPDELWFGRWYGNLDRVRHGWYGSRDLPPLGPSATRLTVVYHWGDAAVDAALDAAVRTAGGTPNRHAVTLETARAQLARCAPARLPRRS